mgnify:CR=1 FL=1
MGNTKEDILLASLQLFSRDGYEAVSVSQIAGELGMTKGALYRHYQNKRDIFLHIVKRMEEKDSEQAEGYDMPEGQVSDMPEKYQKASVADFIGYSKSMFTYWTEDDFASSFRKMLTLEQFRNDEMQELYQQYLVAGPAGYVKDLFESMGMENAGNRAFQFYANMFFFYSLYDGASDKEQVRKQFDEAMNAMAEELG